ncbi:hypothetical protein, variant [Puccinia triticina 1-1 BBBD Race 1]|uniref:LysM domain-containing protein n=1 Tax=Puccinia triticina (isolate 1-1 / race 1 (BBBD)) TaxID=630390 RepID=A0A0C4EQM4_PUCT1|nr:hypothetical protein, variant [Puccinia triticina 1-1 BBBD Race 1]
MPASLTHHPLTTTTTPAAEQPQASTSHASPDITRPTLKRLTADQQPHTPDTASQIWKTKQPPSRTNGKQPSTQPTTPLANNPNRIKGDRDVLIHRVERGHSLPGIALSYGISVQSPLLPIARPPSR